MKVAIGCDHAAYELKNDIRSFLESEGHSCVDLGTNGPASVDYPDFGRLVSEAVCRGEVERGILICGTGIGMSIVANKFPSIRAALCYDIFTAKMSRMHNDANILVLGARVTGKELAIEITKAWFDCGFDGGRHQNRLDKIIELEGFIANGSKTS